MYLAAILDLTSRRIVGWSMSGPGLPGAAQHVLATHTATGIAAALRTRRPTRQSRLSEIFKINVSMSRRANAWDNAPMESFFKSLKVE